MKKNKIPQKAPSTLPDNDDKRIGLSKIAEWVNDESQPSWHSLATLLSIRYHKHLYQYLSGAFVDLPDLTPDQKAEWLAYYERSPLGQDFAQKCAESSKPATQMSVQENQPNASNKAIQNAEQKALCDISQLRTFSRRRTPKWFRHGIFGLLRLEYPTTRYGDKDDQRAKYELKVFADSLDNSLKELIRRLLKEDIPSPDNSEGGTDFVKSMPLPLRFVFSVELPCIAWQQSLPQELIRSASREGSMAIAGNEDSSEKFRVLFSRLWIVHEITS